MELKQCLSEKVLFYRQYRLKIPLFIRYITLIIIVYSSSVASKPTLTVIYDAWLPVMGISQTDTEGYTHTIIQHFLGEEYELAFKTIPYSRASEMLQTGQIDIVLVTAKSDIEDHTHVISPQKTIESLMAWTRLEMFA